MISPVWSRDPVSLGCIPGWYKLIPPVRTTYLFWHRIWIDCGRPHGGVVADIRPMRKTMARYHAAIRQIRKDEANIVNKRLHLLCLKIGIAISGKKSSTSDAGHRTLVVLMSSLLLLILLIHSLYCRDLYTSCIV